MGKGVANVDRRGGPVFSGASYHRSFAPVGNLLPLSDFAA